jgi:nucleoside-diphosphate-sugar epimerase
VRIFVTGATGFVGGAVASAARERGHEVTGLARSETASRQLRNVGVVPCPGDVADPSLFATAAAAADVVVHAAFARDAYDRLEAAVSAEQRVTRALLDACQASGARFVYTSGIGVVGTTAFAVDEDGPYETPSGMRWRRELELAAVESGGVVVRPAFVYGRGGSDVLRSLILAARRRGASLYPVPGDQPWPNVHVDDLARAYLLAAKGPGATVFNIAAGATTPRQVCEAIGRLIGAASSTRSIPVEEARELVPYADWLGGGGVRVDAGRARQVLGWQPNGPELTWDIEFGSYVECGRRKG